MSEQGERLKKIRISLSLNQTEFAELAKMDASYIKDTESGRYNITIGNLRKICKALDMTMVDLFKNY